MAIPTCGRRLAVLGLWLTVALAGEQAGAADLYWFGDGATAGGNGNWSAAGMTWSTTTPMASITVWDPTRTGVFQAPAGTVTVTDMNIDAAAGLRFETDLYTITGGSVTLTGVSSVLNSLEVGAAATATSDAAIGGSAGLTKVGAGTFDLAAANSYTGETVVEGGTLRVSGSTANAANTYVGYANGGTTLAIADGGTASSTSSYLAVVNTSSGNTATVSGMGSTWTNAADLVIGYVGGSNAMTVSAGGASGTDNGFVGYDAASANNSVLITGAGSQWTNGNVLYVGWEGDGNSFTVADGATALSSKDTVVGFGSNASGNSLTVEGTDSTFTVSSPNTLIIGDDGDASALLIQDGGAVEGHNARLARGANSANNTVTVTGTDSRWTNTGTIRVGTLGPGNSVMVSAGAAVSFDGNAFIGHGLAAANNTVTVTGTGSSWSSAILVVGLASTGNVLNIVDGGAAAATPFTIAGDAGSQGTVNVGSGGLPGTLDGPIEFGLGTGLLNFNHSAPSYDFASAISGPGAVRHIGSGTTTMSGMSTYSGGTTLTAGTLRLGADNALPSTGTFSFNGGTFDANDHSVSLGILSLDASSTLRFGSAGSQQDVVFAAAAPWVGGTLTIEGWDGGGGGAYDRLIIVADPTASGILEHIEFAGYPGGVIWKSGTGEVFPRAAFVAPAPSLSPAALALLLAVLSLVAFVSLSRGRR